MVIIECDYCSSRSAVLYCRADSARLCIPCDNHVHSANTLSGKHHRSQICDNCCSAPCSVRCSTDNLLLCSDCDFDAHPITSTHLRSPAPLPFSGTPSPIDLANLWGIHLFTQLNKDDNNSNKNSNNRSEEFNCWNELMVPNDFAKNTTFVNCCGKQGQVVAKQLLELLGDDPGVGGPGTPNGGGEFIQGQEHEVDEGISVGDGGGGGEFTSLLMMQMQTTNTDNNNNNNNDDVMKEEGDGGFLWNANSTRGTSGDHSSQIWDFKLGQLRGHDGSGSLELDFGGSDMEYFTKSYGELLKEAPGTRRGGLDFPGVSCSFANDEMIPFNGAPNNQAASQGPATSESNNIAASCSGFNTRPKSYGCSKEIQFTGESVLVKSESGAAATTNADLELLAKNRGTAMQRYMEKKKNRRYDKQIRYESRKARADTRKRVKGRFVKASDPREG